ncbi:cation transport protein-domain-containing protein [Dactylonectria macrodidyma]|uniref:Potassium transport protein n=1 Tax=Dactylonectria macrodidyma TaxID=307937 RepID=A0A9P9FQ76_9HYPO|nr:cation transport protein-domain-containing protein [Dactylonectria macrodidyma]
MLDRARAFGWAQLKAVKPAFVSRSPHFNFISVHYTWIIGATLLASIIIYVGGTNSVTYINALMFASGANTQAGLNPADLMDLNTFQQIVIYLFTMISNPITLHSSVVFLRLYWFEKRFQGWVSDARQRRGTLSKSKVRPPNETRSAEEGVKGRSITVVPNNGWHQRMTNDGILLDGNEFQSQAIVDDDDDDEGYPPAKSTPANSTPAHSDESDTATVSGARSNSMDLRPEQAHANSHNDRDAMARTNQQGHDHILGTAHTAITFADTVKRSDGIDDDTKFPQKPDNADHIAIVQRQREADTNDAPLRIPGPREADKGMGPRRLDNDDAGDADDDTIAMTRSNISKPDHAAMHPPETRDRRPTIMITEPERPVRDDTTDDAKHLKSALESFRLRSRRARHRSGNEDNGDNESGRPVSAFRTRTLDTIKSAWSRDAVNDMPYLSYTPTMARNSNFVGLTLEQREELGGIEYRSLRTLALILICYFWGFQMIAVACLLPFIRHNQHYGDIVEASGINKTWWGFWTANSAFMDLGFTLTPDSMNSFNTSEYAMMIMWFFIIIGNTGFPVMLRFIIWVLATIVPRGTGLWEELRFLLDHPRRCFTLLFPSSANWWLFWILAGLNVIDLLFFMILDASLPLHSGAVSELPVHTRVADGLFQAAATRTAGFSCFSMSALHPAMPVLYMIMMYISVFPIAISIRRTNVYEEKSLGVYPNKKDEDLDEPEASALSYVGTHLRRQLSFDLWYVFVGFFLLAISEGNKVKNGDFDLFAILFEVVSAYGTVGLSIGIPTVNASLCSQFTVVGKIIIIAMQIRGRHRGLPYGLDRAVLLPSESRFQTEAEAGQPMLARSRTGASTAGTVFDSQDNATTGRRGSTSQGRARAGSVITSFLLLGPPVATPDHIPGHKRTSSGTSQQFPRAATEPNHPQEQDEVDDVGPLRTIESHNFQPRRAGTTPMP